MNSNKSHHASVQDRMRGSRILAPTPALRERVLGAARQAWQAAPPDEAPWRGPMLRLAASLLLALLPVFLARRADAVRRNERFARFPGPSPAARETAALWVEIGQPERARLSLLADARRTRDAAKATLHAWRHWADPVWNPWMEVPSNGG